MYDPMSGIKKTLLLKATLCQSTVSIFLHDCYDQHNHQLVSFFMIVTISTSISMGNQMAASELKKGINSLAFCQNFYNRKQTVHSALGVLRSAFAFYPCPVAPFKYKLSISHFHPQALISLSPNSNR